MFKCGITGSKGNLGKTFVKNSKIFKFIKFKGDISKKKDVNRWIKNNEFDLIIHFAAIVPITKVNNNYKKALQTNYYGTTYLVDAIIKYNKKLNWFFFASTSHVYPFKKTKLKESDLLKPISKYGETKMLAEKYIIRKFRKTKFEFCIGRIFSILDNKGKEFFLKSLINKINIKENKINLKNMNHFRDFLTTLQISRIIIKLFQKKFKGIINIGSGKKIDLKKIAKMIAKKYEKEVFFIDNQDTCSVSSNTKLNKLGIKLNKLNISKELSKLSFFNF